MNKIEKVKNGKVFILLFFIFFILLILVRDWQCLQRFWSKYD